MYVTQVVLVQTQALPVNIAPIGAIVTVGTERNQVVVFMTLTFLPWDDVVNFNLNVAAGWDGASMARLDRNSPS